MARPPGDLAEVEDGLSEVLAEPGARKHDHAHPPVRELLRDRDRCARLSDPDAVHQQQAVVRRSRGHEISRDDLRPRQLERRGRSLVSPPAPFGPFGFDAGRCIACCRFILSCSGVFQELPLRKQLPDKVRIIETRVRHVTLAPLPVVPIRVVPQCLVAELGELAELCLAQRPAIAKQLQGPDVDSGDIPTGGGWLRRANDHRPFFYNPQIFCLHTRQTRRIAGLLQNPR